jgi:hypothetical protein
MDSNTKNPHMWILYNTTHGTSTSIQRTTHIILTLSFTYTLPYQLTFTAPISSQTQLHLYTAVSVNLYRSNIESDSGVRSNVELKSTRYFIVCWFSPSSCYPLAASEHWKLQIFWKINLDHNPRRHNNNLDSKMLKVETL